MANMSTKQLLHRPTKHLQ